MEERCSTIQTAKTEVRKCKYNPYKCVVTEVRTALGISRTDLARTLGTTTNFVCMVEHNNYYPVLVMRIKIARALNTDSSALWILKESEK